MSEELSRRTLLGAIAPLTVPALLGARAARAANPLPRSPTFPSQDPQLVRETVLYAHSDIERLKSLVEARPELSNSAIDWGFGDWESAIGAAAHMGRRDIAEILVDHGARPDVFTFAMLGHLDAVRAMIEATTGLQQIPGPHGFSLLFHARAGGEAAEKVVAYLEALGDADPRSDLKPLPAETSAYTGNYRYDQGESDIFEIVETRGGLGLERPGEFPRSLLHLGNNEFHPGGARSIRVRFTFEGAEAERVEIFDPKISIRAVRER